MAALMSSNDHFGTLCCSCSDDLKGADGEDAVEVIPSTPAVPLTEYVYSLHSESSEDSQQIDAELHACSELQKTDLIEC